MKGIHVYFLGDGVYVSLLYSIIYLPRKTMRSLLKYILQKLHLIPTVLPSRASSRRYRSQHLLYHGPLKPFVSCLAIFDHGRQTFSTRSNAARGANGNAER